MHNLLKIYYTAPTRFDTTVFFRELVVVPAKLHKHSNKLINYMQQFHKFIT